MQDYFQLYPRLAGMTGTAASSAGELRKIYKLRVMPIPTNRPAIRERLPDRVFGTAEDKWQAIVGGGLRGARQRAARADRHALDRQVGASFRAAASTGASSTTCSMPITSPRKPRSWPAPAAAGKVTVSTNMAGRGTDIKLDEGVADLGGLHVIVTEMHDSARIDRQLAGRCGRQGDPGTFRIYLSLEDDLLVGPGSRQGQVLQGARRGVEPGRSTT